MCSLVMSLSSHDILRHQQVLSVVNLHSTWFLDDNTSTYCNCIQSIMYIKVSGHVLPKPIIS